MKKYLLTGIDPETWRKFKACCDLQGVSMKEAFLEYIDTVVATIRKHPGEYKPRANKHKKGGKKK